MAHSWVLAFPDEEAAFRAYAASFGPHAVLLLDTFDSLAAARRVVATGLRPSAVRLDSGDLAALASAVRAILDAGGLEATRILASGDLDERKIAALVAGGAPIDGFGVGAALTVAFDAPSLGAVYKLVELERDGRAVGVMKSSPDKETYPGRKQIWRVAGPGGAVRDVLDLEGAVAPAGGEPLLEPVMRGGRRLGPSPPMAELRERCRRELARLPDGVRRLDRADEYPVELGADLQRAIARARR
jgi:nicotinate phosphoribosyltransferase